MASGLYSPFLRTVKATYAGRDMSKPVAKEVDDHQREAEASMDGEVDYRNRG